jgi:hypothetical protein
LKIASLKGLFETFSGRVSKLPIEFHSVFLEDLETAIERRVQVLESAT